MPAPFAVHPAGIHPPIFGKTHRCRKSSGAGVWRLLVILAVLAIALTLFLLPVRAHVTFRQHGWQAEFHARVTIGAMVNMGRKVEISSLVETAYEHIMKRWAATGEPVKVPLQKTVRRFPLGQVSRAVRRPMRYFRRRIRFKQLDVHVEVGGSDAMQSALLSGVSWSLIGTVLSQLSRFVRLDPAVPRVQVVPDFAGPACRVEVNCIVGYRLGNAIFAGVWLLWRAIRDREIRAWARDSWRRKGVEGGGRASDSGLDEDGHGEPEGHGRR